MEISRDWAKNSRYQAKIAELCTTTVARIDGRWSAVKVLALEDVVLKA